jgi:hypothetical protein
MVQQWFLGVLAENNLVFGLALAEICQTFGQLWPATKPSIKDMTCPKSALWSLHSMVTSLTGSIWRKWNGPAVVSLVYWFHTSLVLAWLWLKYAKLLASKSIKRTWHVQNQPYGAFIAWWHHSSDPYGGNEMVQQCWFLSCTGFKQPWFWLGSGWNLPNFWQATVPIEHNMSKISPS